jgi:hypothetical protein
VGEGEEREGKTVVIEGCVRQNVSIMGEGLMNAGEAKGSIGTGIWEALLRLSTILLDETNFNNTPSITNYIWTFC